MVGERYVVVALVIAAVVEAGAANVVEGKQGDKQRRYAVIYPFVTK
jgi:hypothetical protein